MIKGGKSYRDAWDSKNPLNSTDMAGHLTFANFKVRAPKLQLDVGRWTLPVASCCLPVNSCKLLVGSLLAP